MSLKLELPIYMDNHATTPMDPRVLDAMLPYFTKKFGNPASRNHAFGWEAEKAVESAREQIARAINADPKEIIFTSGATESDNLAIEGAIGMYGATKGRHIITLKTEHKAVLDTCKHLTSAGAEGEQGDKAGQTAKGALAKGVLAEVTFLDVEKNGLVDLKKLEAAMRPDTVLVAIMAANNEIGVVQDIAAIGKLCHERGVLFFTDAAQAVGKVAIDVKAMNIDIMSISGHKVYGPKGVGALYVRRKSPRVRLSPLIHGGGHERGMRSGTLPTPLIVGLGAAVELAVRELPEESRRLRALRDRLWNGLRAKLDHIYLNGDYENRLPGNLNVSFAYVEGEALMMAIKDIAVSSGSACTSASLEPSYVLKALGIGEDLAHTSIRYGIGRFNTEAEIDFTIDTTVKAVQRLREMSPLYEMAKEGIDLKSVQWSGH
ncbi:IscS subfamily cysteine desulfurase [bacterium]|nr:IscS subfamily cysteine desulfurase [bacterium]